MECLYKIEIKKKQPNHRDHSHAGIGNHQPFLFRAIKKVSPLGSNPSDLGFSHEFTRKKEQVFHSSSHYDVEMTQVLFKVGIPNTCTRVSPNIARSSKQTSIWCPYYNDPNSLVQRERSCHTDGIPGPGNPSDTY